MARPGRPAKTPIDPLYPNRLRDVRLSRNASREVVAEALHIDPSSVGRYERGEQQLGINQIAALATALHAPVSEFFPINLDDTIDVIGEIHADSIIRPYADGRLRAVEAVTPFDPRVTRAAQVRDEALFPLEKGMVVYFEEIAPSGDELAEAVGRFVVVRQHRGALLTVGQLQSAGDDGYMLLGPRGVLLKSKRLESVAVVRMLRASDTVRWHSIDDTDNRDASGAPIMREAAEEAAKFTHKLRRTS